MEDSNKSDPQLVENLGALSLENNSALNTGNSCMNECSCLPEETPEESIKRQQFLALARQVLDQQTDALYKQYAKEQHPKDLEKQKSLILEMQEQYFNHYMFEVYRYQVIHQQQQLDQMREIQHVEKQYDEPPDIPSGDPQSAQTNFSNSGSVVQLPLIPATIWTRQNIAEFKQEILKTQRECCIKIGSLATATIRVPTHPEGTSIVWEFATDHYDLGFGLYFEWDLAPQDTITMNISESSDDEEYEDDEAVEGGRGDDGTAASEHTEDTGSSVNSDHDNKDVERGGRHRKSAPRLPTDELIPIYRRDCHTDVYCGRHNYPGVGVYVFKFDNSFSLWRSKWLYYRIYYSH